jgi:signal transduction histidine kinase
MKTELLAAWNCCQAKCATLSQHGWMNTAVDWLELTGESVPKNWRKTWPTIATAHLPADWPVDPSIGTRFEPSLLSLRSLVDRCHDSNYLRERFGTALRQAKQESMYQLAYGLSHELNNPLANISARAQRLLSEEVNPLRARSMQAIVDQSRRAHEMIVDLMFIARPPQPNFEPVEMANFLQSIIDEYRDRSKERISLRRGAMNPQGEQARSEEKWLVDRRLLADALRALIDNARAACGDGGEIVVTWRRENEEAIICISDNGPGLTASDQTHAFDPYYSGRESGRGLGMGLSKVACIAKLHGGEAYLEDRHPGCQATLRLATLRQASSGSPQ